MKKLIVVLVLMSIAGAALARQSNGAAQVIFEDTIPTCKGEADCRAKWEAAQLWLVQHSELKIKTISDVVIATRRPKEHEATLSIQVTKEPLGGGVYRIVFSGTCDNIFGCIPKPYVAGAKFNQAVAAARP